MVHQSRSQKQRQWRFWLRQIPLCALVLLSVCTTPTDAHYAPSVPQQDYALGARAERADFDDQLSASWQEALSRRRHKKHSSYRHSRLIACLSKYNIEHVSDQGNSTEVYFQASQSENTRYHYLPVAIAYAKNVHEVADTVRCAASHGNTQTVVRSGGHSFAGFSAGGRDGALIIDFKHMDHIDPQPQHDLVHLGPGAMLGDVIKQLYKHGKRATAHGTCPTVAIGGHGLCGGVGPTSHKWGLAIDNLIEAQVVLANASIVRASQHENYDLWWALKGAGSFFGVVTSYTLKTYDASGPSTTMDYRWAGSLKTLDDAAELMMGIQTFAMRLDLPDKLGFHVQIAAHTPGKDDKDSIISMQLRGVYLGSKAEMRDIMSKLWAELRQRRLSIATPDLIHEKETDFVGVMGLWDDFAKSEDKLNTYTERKIKLNFVQRSALSMGRKGFSKESIEQIIGKMWDIEVERKKLYDLRRADYVDSFVDLAMHPWGWNMYFELFGTANSRMNSEDVMRHSSFVHRDALWLMQASIGARAKDTLVHDAYVHLHGIYGAIKRALEHDGIPRRSFSCYTDPTLEDWKESYYGDALPRLVDIKRQVDPNNLFRTPQSLIQTAHIEEEEPEIEDDEDEEKEDTKGAHVKISDDKPSGQEDIHPLPR